MTGLIPYVCPKCGARVIDALPHAQAWCPRCHWWFTADGTVAFDHRPRKKTANVRK